MRSFESKPFKDAFVDNLIATMNRFAGESETDLRKEIYKFVDGFLSLDAKTDLREVTILLADIRGFTSLSERNEASVVVRMLNNYFAQMNKVILQYEGVIDKYIGDAILVLFGAPEAGEDDPQRAVTCAIEMEIAMDRVNEVNRSQGLPELFVGIGVNTGTVSAGQIGSDLHAEYTVIGDGVNLAARIESHSLRGQVLISENTYGKVRDIVEVGRLNTVRVKGKNEPIEFYELIGRTGDRDIQVPRREVRASIRVEVESGFQFQVLDGKEVVPKTYQGRLKDISYNGFFALVPEEIAPFTDIRISLSLSLLGGESRDIDAKVMSVRSLQDGYGCGVQFTSLDDDCRQGIKDFIDRIVTAD